MAGKKDLVDQLKAAIPDLSQQKASEIVDVVFDSIDKLLREGEKVTIPGFGSFFLVERAARKGRNSATGASISIEASRRVRFKPAPGTGSTGPRRR